MPAHKVVSPAQMEHILQYMENNRCFATGRLKTNRPLGNQAHRQKWEALAAELNAFRNGATKTARKWRDYWCEKKYAVRKKAQEKSLHARGTGGGRPKNITLTPTDERILALMGNVAVKVKAENDHFEEDTSAVYLDIPPSPLMPEGSSPARPVFSPVSEEKPAPHLSLEFQERNAAAQERNVAAQERQAAALEAIPRMLSENRAAVEQLTTTAAGITAAIVAMTNELAAIRKCVNRI